MRVFYKHNALVVAAIAVLFVLVSAPWASLSAQMVRRGVTITGTVKDDSGNNLVGATISTPSGSAGTIADNNGAYKIVVPSTEKTLVFSYLGMKEQTVMIDNRLEINVVLGIDEKLKIEEVVVIGYGQTKKSDLTGSVASIKMTDTNQAPVASVDQALQGRIAGVDIMSTTGEPGATTSIRIRGTRSVSASNEPLIVVDGVIDAVQDLSDIDSSDIDNISVLKDASSTAIYGARGSNGVIIVTTKGGKGKMDKFNVTAKAQVGVSMLARKLDLMNAQEFIRYRNDYSTRNNPSAPAKYDPNAFGEGTDWQDAITRPALFQNYNLSFNGRSRNSNYYGALSYTDNQGVVKGSGFNRVTGRINLSHKFTKWFAVDVRIGYTYRDQDLNKAIIGGSNIYTGAIYLNPTMGLRDNTNPLYDNGSLINTPVSEIEQVIKIQRTHTFTPVFSAIFTPVKGLTIKSQNSYMLYKRSDYQFWPSTLPKRVNGEGADAYRYEGDAMRLTSENTVSYRKDFKGGHHFDILGGYTAMKENVNRFSLKALGLTTDELTWNNMSGIMSKDNYTASTEEQDVTRQSLITRVNYSYKKRYYVTFTARADGSSNFAANNKWGFFPSAAVKWNISNEKWMRKVKWIDELSLRGSVGRTGNDAITSYRSLSAYGSTTNGYIFNGSQNASFYPTRIENPDLTWEKTILYNVALNWTMFHGRLELETEFYASKTNDLLLTLKTPLVTGYSSRYTNLGETTNQGFEVTIQSRNIEKPKFIWTTAFTLSHNSQMVNDVGTEEYVAALSSGWGTPYMMYGYKAGYPLNALWGFQYAGVWKSDAEFERNKSTKSYASATAYANSKNMVGMPKYVDVNNDGILTIDDLVYQGKSDPIIYGGLQNTFTIMKNLKIGIYFTYSVGGKIYNYSELAMTGSYTTNQYRYMLDAFHPVRNPESNLPAAGTAAAFHVPSSLQIHDASYLRFKSFNVFYTFDLRKKTKALRDITIGVTGENLFLWSDYNGFDPDVSSESSSSTLRRVDMGAYPRARQFVFNLQIRY